MKFIRKPLFPENDIELCAVSEADKSVLSALTCLGIKCIVIKKSALLQKPVASHADMLLHYAGQGKVFAAQMGETEEKLAGYGFSVDLARPPVSPKYPNDVGLNVAPLGKMLFCGKKTHNNLTEYYEKAGYKLLLVPQGYVKCSICAVNEEAIITSDSSISSVAAENGFDILTIREGYIKLPGFDHGFIGGACGMIGKNTLAFTGDIKKHPDYENISAFCKNHKAEIISLTENDLTDIGGIMPLAEKF